MVGLISSIVSFANVVVTFWRAAQELQASPLVIRFSRYDWRVNMAHILRSVEMASQGITDEPGNTLRVRPFVIESPLEEISEVRRFQIRSDGKGGVLIVVAPAFMEAGLNARVTAAVDAVLRLLARIFH